MSKYLELKQQAEALLKQAELARTDEIAAAVVEIKEKMKFFELTLQDLKLAGIDVGHAHNRPTANASIAKYKGPNGELWAGGRGQKPKWAIQVITENGISGLEAYRIN